MEELKERTQKQEVFSTGVKKTQLAVPGKYFLFHYRNEYKLMEAFLNLKHTL